jgi:hypothetical protein
VATAIHPHTTKAGPAAATYAAHRAARRKRLEMRAVRGLRHVDLRRLDRHVVKVLRKGAERRFSTSSVPQHVRARCIDQPARII